MLLFPSIEAPVMLGPLLRQVLPYLVGGGARIELGVPAVSTWRSRSPHHRQRANVSQLIRIGEPAEMSPPSRRRPCTNVYGRMQAIDPSMTSESIQTRATQDPLLSRSALEDSRHAYLGRVSARDPSASPLHGDLASRPPVLLHVGEYENLIDDARRYADRPARFSGYVENHVREGMVHIFSSQSRPPAGRESRAGHRRRILPRKSSQ